MSSGINLSKLTSSSGVDWSSVVDQLIELEKKPITTLQTEQKSNTEKNTDLANIGTLISSLRKASNALKGDGLFNARTAASTTTNSTWGLSAANDTAVGTYTVSVSQLAKASVRNGASDIGYGLSTTSDVSGVTLATMNTAVKPTAGTFSVNGNKVTIAVTDSLKSVFDKISAATGGDVTATYDPSSDKISLTSASGNLVLGASNDTSNFLTSMRLSNNGTGTATSSSALGSTSTTATLASAGLRTALTAGDASGNGSFTINGTPISYNVNTDTMATVMARITASDAGVTASYDAAADRVVLTNKITGDTGIGVSDTSGNLAAALGLGASSALTRGQNALFSINGGPTLVSSSNTFDASAHGITGLSITAQSATTETITVKANTDTMKSTITDFISAFNNVQDYIEETTKITTTDGEVTTQSLSSNREVQDWANKLRTIAFGSISGLSGSITRLYDLGIDFKSGSNNLEIKDDSKLTKALTNNASDVAALFGTASSDGLVSKLDKFITTVVGSSGDGGTLRTQRDTLTKANKTIDSQIEVLNRRIAQQREQLESAFAKMNDFQTQMKSTSSLLDRLYNKSTSSS